MKKMTMVRRASLAFIALIFGAGGAAGATCSTVTHETHSYAVCEVPVGADLRLFLTGADGRPMGTFDRLRDRLAAEDSQLVFAMNGGMYHSDRAPVGLYVESGREMAPLVTSAGPGNFGMQPNGVFCIEPDRFSVIETLEFSSARPQCDFATQSGPMLVLDGRLHPRFLKDSDSRHIRNGVGVSDDGQTAYFAISDAPVNFDEFARLFRDKLVIPNALYFDGRVSRLYAPEIGRDDIGFPMGPMVGLVAPGR